jgi:AraC-like DNA-binding protein
LSAFFGTPVQECAIGTELIGEVLQEPAYEQERLETFTWRDLRRLVSSRPSESFADVLHHLCIPFVQNGIFDLDKVAKKVGVTPRTIQRRLKTEGETFGSLLSRLRREQADNLLTGTTLTLSEIAEEVGYSSKQHFIRAYKGWTGKTPSTLRK